MNKIKMFLNRPEVKMVGILIIGMLIGLVVLGWGLWPLEWVDASPADLQMDYQRDYLCMVIESYIVNQDNALVQLRWEGLGENASALLDTLTPAVCGFGSSDAINAFKDVISYAPQSVPAGMMDDPSIMSPVADSAVKPENTLSIVPLVILVVLTLVVGGLFLFLMKRRKNGPRKPASHNKKQEVKLSPARRADNKKPSGTIVANAQKKGPALAQFMTTFRQGDDLYDDSFSIDSVNGEFLGECGVGIAETIGVGDPKKVTALEVWLFDKNDIQTVTKILMSEHASNDSAIRQRLLSKGEPVKVEPGMTFVMETASLQLEAKVIDMVYARGPLPENSNFSRITLEISVWSK